MILEKERKKKREKRKRTKDTMCPQPDQQTDEGNQMVRPCADRTSAGRSKQFRTGMMYAAAGSPPPFPVGLSAGEPRA